MDILDYIPAHLRTHGSWVDPRRWSITYESGQTRKSQYRHDLIRNSKRTALTPHAKKEWPEWDGAIYGDPSRT